MLETNFAWVAGIIDGEGYFHAHKHVSKKGNPPYEYRFPSLQVGQKGIDGCPDMLFRLRELFGGYINGPYNLRGIKCKWQWRISGYEQVQQALIVLWSWLGPVKRDQAKTVLLQCQLFPKIERLPPNKGRIRSEEFKRKVSESMKL
jgi:hypothetical protein